MRNVDRVNLAICIAMLRADEACRVRKCAVVLRDGDERVRDAWPNIVIAR